LLKKKNWNSIQSWAGYVSPNLDTAVTRSRRELIRNLDAKRILRTPSCNYIIIRWDATLIRSQSNGGSMRKNIILCASYSDEDDPMEKTRLLALVIFENMSTHIMIILPYVWPTIKRSLKHGSACSHTKLAATLPDCHLHDIFICVI